jgi:hypothetical protein
MKDVGILNGHLVICTAVGYIFVAIWYILWLFGILYQEKIWQPW